MNLQQLLKYYRLFDDVKHPRYATEDSACFDLYTYFKPNDKIVIYSAWQEDNPKGKRDVNSNGVFDPSSAGVGTHSISYSITGSCPDSYSHGRTKIK